MSGCIVTVESGGSKTRICTFSSCGELAGELRCGGVGAVGNADLTEFRSTISAIDGRKVSNVIVNLGGTNVLQIKDALDEFFPNARVEVYRESSGVVMGAVCDMEKADVLLMAGTGSICLAKGEKGTAITDGWGADIGDKGSGYWIGMEAISRSLSMLEEGRDLSPLAKYITGQSVPFEATNDTEALMKLRDEVRRNFLPLNREKTASFAKIAGDFAKNGDKTARKIFCDAGKHLAETVIRAMKLACCKDGATVLVSGGLTGVYDLWKTSFENTFDINCHIRAGEADMTKGMLYYIKSRRVLR